MKVGYVVLYVDDAEACLRFWIEQVGFTDQDVSFELVPLALTKDNTDGLGLATPVSRARPTYRTKTRSHRLQAALGL